MSYCGECCHLYDEDSDGYGWCTHGPRVGLMCHCSTECCICFEERISDGSSEE